MNKKILTITAAILLGVTLTTTLFLFNFPYQPKQPPKLNDAGSTQPGMQAIVYASNQFACDLYLEFAKFNENNIFFSPFSIFSALAMTYEGASGKTEEELLSVLHLSNNNELVPNYAAVYNKLNQDKGQENLRMGNALWAQHDFPIFKDFSNRVEQSYGAKAANLDFEKQTEKSRQTINRFIDEQTNGKIKDLLQKGDIGALTKFVLTNAIYFKGNWLNEFDKADTQDKDFTLAVGKKVITPMMQLDPGTNQNFNYSYLDNLQILELPYLGEKFSMTILLPNSNIDSIESSFSNEKLIEYNNNLHEAKLSSIFLPKFEFKTRYDMQNTLEDLGMPIAFTDDANFSKMNLDPRLLITKVIHQAYIKVDEKGTEAAAATAVIGGFKSSPPSFEADHPFIFLIQEKSTGLILFMGRLSDPTMKK
ncbi:serpin family protein [Candidatus Lokiarchaeum ossiferum]|uniref:serpin family protein n=1 Tax=Candidatus Lokiarchaeum ossiferum TaxID=2951803 RepID=UPI00352F293E